MKPYYEHAGITIYHGDCREVLPALEIRADAVVTDPPYGIVNQFGEIKSGNNGRRALQFDWDDAKITDDVIEGLSQSFSRVHSKAGVFVFCGGDQLGRVFDCLRRHDFTAKPACWVKECPPPAGLGNWWPSGFEYAAYGYRTGAYFGDDDPKRSNVFVADSYRHGQPSKVNHPTQKPLGLMRRLVRAIVPEGGLCIDCFAGSGSTLLAAKLEGRRCVGVELDEKYAEIAANRLAQEVLF